MPTAAGLGTLNHSLTLDTHLHDPVWLKRVIPHSTMATSFSQGNHVNSESYLRSQPELDHDRMSFVKRYTGLTKIENLTYRLGYLSSFISAIEETLEISSTLSFIFRCYSKEVCLSVSCMDTSLSDLHQSRLWG